MLDTSASANTGMSVPWRQQMEAILICLDKEAGFLGLKQKEPFRLIKNPAAAAFGRFSLHSGRVYGIKRDSTFEV